MRYEPLGFEGAGISRPIASNPTVLAAQETLPNVPESYVHRMPAASCSYLRPPHHGAQPAL
jgi:hypothetical protein